MIVATREGTHAVGLEKRMTWPVVNSKLKAACDSMGDDDVGVVVLGCASNRYHSHSLNAEKHQQRARPGVLQHPTDHVKQGRYCGVPVT